MSTPWGIARRYAELSWVTTRRLAARERRDGGVMVVLRAMRPRQWVKNGLVFIAPLAAGRILEPAVLVASLVAFVSFSMVASAVYLVNDIVDAEADRQHPVKRHRPIAAGSLSAPSAVMLAITLVSGGLGLAASATPRALVAVLSVYALVSLAYSFGLKNQPVLDLAVVASGFVLRAFGGGAASGVMASQWLVLTAAAGALFLVAGKRYSEVLLVGEGSAQTRPILAAYSLAYLRFVWGTAATVTVTMAALWASEVATGFARPFLAQASVAPFILGVLRYAWWIDRGAAGAPETVVLGDRVLLALGASWLAMFALGSGMFG